MRGKLQEEVVLLGLKSNPRVQLQH
uniref:Uncharacterized protein n=1 Tax=Rhizophora mucronata TaxID=61149 RepID=A0A2P2NL82_RHIMU